MMSVYRDREQQSVRFRPSSWAASVFPVAPEALTLLSEDGYTDPKPKPWKGASSDRIVSRRQVLAACGAMDLTDRASILSAFVLVMAWGTGTTGNRSLHNTRGALEDHRAFEALARSCALLRAAEGIQDGHLREAHQRFSLARSGQAFHTKWFAFAGHVDGRDWQPLILDSLVYRSLNETLGVSTRDLAGSRLRANRYVAYVGATHAWASELSVGDRLPVTAERLEWIMFDHARIGDELAPTASPSP